MLSTIVSAAAAALTVPLTPAPARKIPPCAVWRLLEHIFAYLFLFHHITLLDAGTAAFECTQASATVAIEIIERQQFFSIARLPECP